MLRTGPPLRGAWHHGHPQRPRARPAAVSARGAQRAGRDHDRTAHWYYQSDRIALALRSQGIALLQQAVQGSERQIAMAGGCRNQRRAFADHDSMIGDDELAAGSGRECARHAAGRQFELEYFSIVVTAEVGMRAARREAESHGRLLGEKGCDLFEAVSKKDRGLGVLVR